jgi:2-oxoisovalerate dehydrogenase E2 component (dihydrolipoyl transacylase)
MTIQSIKMPDIGEGIAEVEVVAWRVAVGDAVTEDQILADVMTDKATVEIPSHVSGTVVSLDAAVGEVVAVGTPIIHIKTAVALIDSSQAAIDSEATSPVAGAPAAASQPVAAAPPAPPAIEMPKVTSAPAPAPLQSSVRMSTPAAGERAIAAPAVRRRAWELGIDLSTVSGTGPAGRITQADLDAATGRRP